MFLTSDEHHALKDCFALLAEDHNEREIRERMGHALLRLLGADHFASYVWDAGAGAFGGRIAIHMGDANLARYEAWYQYRDPVTFLLQSRRHATLVSEVMPRGEFLRTEFYNDFLSRDGLCWGINLHAFDGDQALGDLRIWRGRGRQEFDERDKQLLDLLEPAFAAALRRARAARGGALALLSPREREVALCIARGLTNKEIARELGLSLPSVNTYLSRIFEKTGVRRRSALAQLAHGAH
jgi:DNA-binding CsgD family transcriptional regulator